MEGGEEGEGWRLEYKGSGDMLVQLYKEWRKSTIVIIIIIIVIIIIIILYHNENVSRYI